MTRNVWKTLLLVLLFPPLASAGASADPPADAAQPLLLSVVIDSSPAATQTWQQLKASACQAVDSLAPDDRVVILRAGNGEPSLHSDSLIESPDLAGRQNLRQCIRDIRQVFPLSKADVARAVATAFEHLGKHSEQYDCAVIVFSTGNLTDDQVRQVRRLAAAYRARGWSLALLVQPGARRELFVAASQGEFEVMLLDKVNLAWWLEKARQGAAKSEEPPELPRSGQSDQPESIDSKPTVSPILPTPVPTPQPPEPPRRAGEPNGAATRYLLPVYPVPRDRVPFPIGPEVKPPAPAPASPKTKPPSWLRSIVKNKYTPAVVVGSIILGLIVLVVLAVRSASSGEDLPDLEEYGTAGTPQKLMCTVEDRRHDLGEEDAIRTLVFGSGPASAVPFADDEELEDEHAKVFRRRRGYKIKNCAEQPIVVDGTSAKKGQKMDLLLPATIELTKKSKMTLFREPVLSPEPEEMQTASGDTYESENV